ncbi:hypothetical protein [Streptomyces mayteni]
MTDPPDIAARRAVAAAYRTITRRSLRSGDTAAALVVADQATNAAYDRGHRVADIHPPLHRFEGVR